MNYPANLPSRIFLVFVCLGILSPALSYGASDETPKSKGEDTWKFNNETTLNATVITGNSESITIGGDEKFTTKKKNVTNVLVSGVMYARDDIFNDAIPAKTASRNIFIKDKALWEFRKRIYSYVGSAWLTNQSSGIDSQFDGFGGFGYKLLVLPHHSLSVEAGYQFEHQTQVDPFPDEGATQNATFELDYLWKATDKTSVENETESVLDMNHSDNVRVSSHTRLKVEIIEHLALTVGFKLQFDNSPVPTFKKLDTISTTGITFSL